MAVRIADKKPGGVLVGKRASVEAVATLLAAQAHAKIEILGSIALDSGDALTRAAVSKAGDVEAVILCGFVDDRAAARKLLDQISALRLRPFVA
ncbi:MAG: hypothetical protein ABUS57_19145, partial [Pseudomonadota bacterium]